MGDLTGWKIAPDRPTPEMIDRGVAFALNVSIGRDYRWTEYVSDLYGRMLSAAPSTTPPSPPDHIVLPSRDDIAREMPRIAGIIEEWLFSSMSKKKAADAILALLTPPEPAPKPSLDTVEGVEEGR